MARRERIIEGTWTCSSCGATKVLGRHKTCPGCGNPREQGTETKFDFGERTATGASTAATVTEANALSAANAGADWHCGYCESANRGDGAVCRSCGASRADAQPAVAPAPPPPPLPAAALPARRRVPWGLMTVLGMVLSCGFCWWGGRTREVTGDVVATSWRREATLQTFTPARRRGWRDQLTEQAPVMPVNGAGEVAGVLDIRDCQRKQRGTRQVADGTERVCTTRSRQVACGTEERCHTEDQGNGFAREVCDDVTKYCSESYEDCEDRTRYRTEPVYGDECLYDTWAWETRDTRTTNGTTEPLRWPDLAAGEMQRLLRKEDYEVQIAWGGGERHVVKTPSSQAFLAYKPGGQAVLVVTNLGTVKEARPR